MFLISANKRFHSFIHVELIQGLQEQDQVQDHNDFNYFVTDHHWSIEI